MEEGEARPSLEQLAALREALSRSKKVVEGRLEAAYVDEGRLEGLESEFKAHRQVLESSVAAVKEATAVYEETLRRLRGYDERLAKLEASAAKRRRWRAQVEYLKTLDGGNDDDDEAKPPTPPPPARTEKVNEEAAVLKARASETASAEEAVATAEKFLSKFGSDRPMMPVLGSLQQLMGYAPSEDPFEDSIEEAAGWLHAKARNGRWKRRWFALKTHQDFGPFLEAQTEPGGPKLHRIVLENCDVNSIDDRDAVFEFVLTHPHQLPRTFSTVNKLTRKQWISVLAQLIRDHAKNARKQDDQIRGSGFSSSGCFSRDQAERNLRKAKLRLDLLRARAQADLDFLRDDPPPPAY